MMDGVVIFNESQFLLRYPQFATWAAANPGALQLRFDEVTALYINNTIYSNVRDVGERSILINLAIAHILQLEGITSAGGQGSTAGQVGRVSQATEGTVSASLDMGATPNTGAWWMQTQYGASFWNATAKYRSARFVRPRRCGC